MTEEVLGYMNMFLEGLSIPYEFMEWTSKVPNTYWVGEYNEVESLNEDGYEECDFILMGTTNESFAVLEAVKEQLKNVLGCCGITDILENGSGLCIEYSSAFPVPSVDFGVKRMQITLKVKEWRVNYV